MAEHIQGPLHWEQVGRHGPPMIFVHPNPMDSSGWLYQMAHFSTWFSTISIDLPGYGHSPKAEPGLTMRDVAQACWEAVDQVTSAPAVLAGCSAGANTVQHMANQRPEQVRALIVSGSGYSPDFKEFAPRVIGRYEKEGLGYREPHMLEDFSPQFGKSELGQYFVKMYVERNTQIHLPTVIEGYRAVGQPDPEWLFDGIRAPMLVISGSEDRGHERAMALQKRIRGCELVAIQGAGHACYMEKPWEWDAAVLRFLARHDLIELHFD